jgi:hypothetical protein
VGKYELKKLLNEGIEDVKNNKLLSVEDSFKRIREGLENERL